MGGCQPKLEFHPLWPPLLCAKLGGTAAQVLIAEIAMEHHLGLPATLLRFSTDSVY
jgi:hypothetical protein